MRIGEDYGVYVRPRSGVPFRGEEGEKILIIPTLGHT